MNQEQIGGVVKELHGDLARKWARHAPNIDKYWRAFDPAKRAKCIKMGAKDGVVLQHPMDMSMGNICKLMPEYNLRDLTADPDWLLNILKHRATRSLSQQYAAGINGQPGDHAHIVEMMAKRNLAHVDSFKDCYTFFVDSAEYGFSFKIAEYKKLWLAYLATAIKAQLCIPQSVGELVLNRQMYLLQSLNILIEDILEEGSKTRIQSKPAKKTGKEADILANAVSMLAVDKKKVKLSLPTLIAMARDQKASLEENLELLTTEPVVLAHAVNHCYFSRPELIPDEKGRVLAATDKYISGAVFDAVHQSVRSVAIWDYMNRLLDLISSSKDKVYRTILLQELSNVCHLEYSRAQAVFRAQVQTGSGRKSFYRRSNVVDKTGRPSIALKGKGGKAKAEDLVHSQLNYLLRLCQPETTAPKALEWLFKLTDLHERNPSELQNLSDRELEALCDLATITFFIHDLSPAISLPPLSHKNNQMFVSRLADLDVELTTTVKPALDLLAFASPINHLLKPSMATAALAALDALVVAKTGASMGFLHQDLITDCLAHLSSHYERTSPPPSILPETSPPPSPLPSSPPPPAPARYRVEERKKKSKTRPPGQPPPFPTVSPPSSSAPAAPEPPPPPIPVSPATSQVFATLFSKREARGALAWTAFCAAMTELGFAVEPKFGSVFAFSPPARLADEGRGALVIHRPHGSHFDDYAALKVRKRLSRKYGWGEGTFVVA
ncbi:hypothetical protein QBC39DRAFT_254518 [Podospora conica]|nr:hypothetical protein QBC39DRAFT_254518 [Schizothecium conicum]